MEKTFNCNICTFGTDRLSSYTRHLQNKHGVIEQHKKKQNKPKQPKQDTVLSGFNITEVKDATANLKHIAKELNKQQEFINVGKTNADAIIQTKDIILNGNGTQTDAEPQEKMADMDTTVTLGTYLKSVINKLNKLYITQDELNKKLENLNKKTDVVMSRVCPEFSLQIDA